MVKIGVLEEIVTRSVSEGRRGLQFRPRLRVLELHGLGGFFGRRPLFTVACGNAAGIGCVDKIVWPTAKFTFAMAC